MVRAVPLEASMFPELYSSFLAEDDPRLQESHWRRLFQPPDLDDVRPPGYCLVDSSRIHEDGTSLVCNLHSWMVRPEHRGRSLGLMRPLLKQHDITVTDFSPTRQVFRLMLKMGMKALDGRLRVLLPMPFGRRDADLELIADPVSIEAALSNDDTRILRNHQLPWCRHALLRTPGGDCYIVWSKVDRWAVPYGYIHYVSDRQVFTRHSRLVRARLLDGSACRFLAMDERITAGMALPGSVVVPWGSRQLYRSNRLDPSNIDTLYSEVTHLNLATMPSIRAAASETVAQAFS